MTKTKSIFVSKTFWVNFLTTALAVLQYGELVDIISPNVMLAIVGMINILLRFLTSAPVTVLGTEDGR